MKVGLDYDGTYTRNPQFWDAFITLCINHLIDVRIVTMRYEKNRIDAPLTIPIIYTNMKQKREFCDEIDWHPDIWIDDTPEMIVRQSALEYIQTFGSILK